MDARALLDNSPHAVLVVDSAGLLTYVNTAAAQLLGDSSAATLLGTSLLDQVHERHRALAGQLLVRVAGEEEVGREPAYLQLRDGASWVAVRAAPMPGGGWQLAATEVTARIQAHQELRRLASHDELTQLPGRALLLDRLATALSDRRRSAAVAALFVDLDGFKLVNDALGHAAGDLVLQETARRLAACIRPQDTVGRYGGDEFLVVATNLVDSSDAAVLAERVERSLRRPVEVGDDEVLVSASVGVALTSGGQRATAEQLIAEADAAMYRAKSLGKRRYEVFDQAMHERAQERTRLVRVLRDVITDPDRVVVHYQPLVDLRSRRAVGVEALLRLVDDDGSLLLPAAFLDVAIESGLLPALDDQVLTTAAQQVQQWRASLDCDLELSVNVCAARVAMNLEPAVERAFAVSGLPRDRLLVELTEQALISRGPEAGAAISALHHGGTRFALDDFGTGWASLTYLRRFPVSLVKVDRSFVAGVPDVSEDRVIVSTICDMARQLGLECTAEGVETEEQYAVLQELDPPYGQGWLLGRPAAAEDLPALLERIGVMSIDEARAGR